MHRRLTTILTVTCLAAIAHAGDPATQPAAGPSPAEQAFERLKSLVGTWKGKTDQGHNVTVTYALTGEGSALVESLDLHGGMTTVYYVDNDRLLMTHFCAAKNQPRMVAAAPADDGKSVKFDFLDATGLRTPDDGHMHTLEFAFGDTKDAFTQTWTFRQAGKDVMTVKIDWQREPAAK
jgi:hypothetical protein